jgi:predicted O-methyltransferase YrrM
LDVTSTGFNMTDHLIDTVPRDLLRLANDPTWREGSAEPWVTDVLASLLRANATRTAVEIGGFQGSTSRRLAHALGQLPWDVTLTVCEIDHNRADDVRGALASVTRKHRDSFDVVCADSLAWIPTLPDASVDFVWLDGNHEKPHVTEEIRLLLPKLAPGGLLCGHDVFGSCDLQDVFAFWRAHLRCEGMSLNFPKLGPAGGIGLLQRPR